MSKPKHELFIIIGKQAVIIENYKNLLEDIKMGLYDEEKIMNKIDEANKLAAELKDY